jgi:hypothetical protein
VYKPGTQFKKDPGFYGAYVIHGSFFNVHETRTVKPIKDMYQPYFSQAAIQRLESSIHEKIDKFLGILHEATESSKVLDLTLGYKCLTADVVMGYCYNKTFGALDAADFKFKLIEDLEGVFGTASFARYFPGFFNMLSRILEKLPTIIIEMTVKPLAATFEIQRVN